MKTIVLSAVLLCFNIYASFGQGISLVKDLNPGIGSTAISNFTEAGGNLYFAESPGNTYSNNVNLWKTDGTGIGTILLFQGSHITALTSFNNQLYFVASDNINGDELWKTDGTIAGTQMVKDINPGADPAFEFSSYFPIALKEMDHKLYFCANDGVHGQELWVTDGTAQGTHMVIDLNPVYSPATPDGVFNVFEVVGSKIFFDGYDGNEYGIWMTDGTAAGTSWLRKMIKAQNFICYNNKLCYTDVDSGSFVADFWMSDGTISGTTKLYPGIMPSSGLGKITDYTILNNQLFFYSVDVKSLFVTNGAITGTIKLKDSLEYYPSSSSIFQKRIYLTPYNNKVFFSASKTSASDPGELWETDGTPQGTKLFLDLPPYNSSSYPINLVVANSKLFFRAWDAIRVDVWVSDGTVASTYKITDPNADYNSGGGPIAASRVVHGEMCAYNNMLIYGNTYYNAVGQELYRLDLPLNVEENFNTTIDPSIYPNPTTGTFIIDTKNNSFSTLQALNQLGQSVYTQSLNAQQGKQQIRVDGLSNGVYFIKLTGNTRTVTQKITLAQ